MFWDKKEDRKRLPDLPPSKSDQGLAGIPPPKDDHLNDNSSLPAFPDSPTHNQFSQAAIKDAFNEKENGDLNGIIYSDMPWLLQREIPAISRMGKQKNNSARRLFSLGVDSYALLPYLKLLQQQQLKQFAGETAKLYINENGYIKRLFSFAKIQNGKQVLYPPIKVEENYSE